MQYLKQSTSATVAVGPFVDQSDGYSPEVGLAAGTVDEIGVYKHDATVLTDISGTTTFTHRAGGIYTATLSATDTNTAGRMRLYVRDDNVCLPVWENYMVLPANSYDSLVGGTDTLQVDITATEIINPIFHVPPAIDVANTATVRIAIHVVNMVDDLPTTGEITPGTISIDRKAAAATSWSSIVTDAAMSESAGWIYYDEVFDSGTGYARGDIIRFTFKSQAVVAGGNTVEICPAGGIFAYSVIPETNGLTTALIADAVLEELISDHSGVSGSLADLVNSIPANVWANVMEAGAPATAQTALQWMRLMAAALFGETAGTGDWSAKSIDGAKTRLAATLTSAGARSTVSTVDGS
jgi:hypothetical protein